MRSLKRRAINIAKRNPYWTSFICFAEAVKKQKFSRRTIYYWFSELVNEDDYSKEDRMTIIQQLVTLSKNA